MKKKFLVLLLCSVALVSILLTPTLIADDDDDEAIRASGEWKYDIASGIKPSVLAKQIERSFKPSIEMDLSL